MSTTVRLSKCWISQLKCHWILSSICWTVLFRFCQVWKASAFPLLWWRFIVISHCTKTGTTPGYDNIHPEFLGQLGPRALAWLAQLFTRMLCEHRIPKIWRQAKVIALEKPGKDPHLAANYRPISLLSMCYKLLERTILFFSVSCLKLRTFWVRIKWVSEVVEVRVSKLPHSQPTLKMGLRRTRKLVPYS